MKLTTPIMPNKTIGEFREWQLDDDTTEAQVASAGRGCSGEIAAAKWPSFPMTWI
jgi:ethanolamine ammonia-lyase large subunit